MDKINRSAIVIPTYNRKNHLKNILSKLSLQIKKNDCIIVVDDGSTDGTTELLTSYFPNVVHLRGDGNLWWTGSANKGIKFVLKNFPDVKYIVLQNDDTDVDNNWLDSLVSVADNNPHSIVGCVGVDYKNPDIISYAGRTKNPWFAISKKHFIGNKLSEFPKDYLIESFDLIGRGIIFPIDVFFNVGIYDDKNFKHRGDTELPLRARKAGYKLLITFSSVVYTISTTTASIDIKEYYTFSDFKEKFFDFRSSAYWKYRFQYASTLSDNSVQKYCFFICRMFLHLLSYLSKLKYFGIYKLTKSLYKRQDID